MKKMLTTTLLALVAIAALIFIAGQVGLLRGTRPSGLGAPGQRLKAPGATSQNVVSSQAALHPHTDYHVIAPLTFTGAPQQAMLHLQKVLAGMEGASIVSATPDYVHAEFQSKWLKFVDDVEFVLIADKGEIHMRSASRLGRKDFGANRTRLERVRAAFTAQP